MQKVVRYNSFYLFLFVFYLFIFLFFYFLTLTKVSQEEWCGYLERYLPYNDADHV